jgi:hypothetical protein
MKVDIKRDSLFPGNEKEIQEYFELFTLALSEKFEVPSFIFKNLSGLFELFLTLNRESNHIAPIREAVTAIIEWLDTVSPTSVRETFEQTSAYWREANDSFWSMLNSNPTTNDQYSFRENADKLFDTINRVLEFMIKKEGYLLARFEDRNESELRKYDLFSIIERCVTFLNRYPDLAIDNGALMQIPLNQWRNISAHKDFTCWGDKINVTYGRNSVKKAQLSRGEIENACMEIYRTRINVKIITSIVLIVLAARHEQLISIIEFSPKTFLYDINYFFAGRDFRLTQFELTEELVINGEKAQVPEGFSVFNVSFSHKEDTDEQLLFIIQAIARALSHVFGEHNSFPPKEKVVLYFTGDPAFHMIYTYV